VDDNTAGRESIGVTNALIAVGGFVVLIVVVLNLMATVSLIRANGLTRFQKGAQGVIVWMLPFVGAFLVLHLIGQSDRAAIPEWIPDPAINRYVFDLLGIEGKVAERAAEHVVEQAIIDSISGHISHSGAGESGGADGGH
jgi:hypothetical protein